MISPEINITNEIEALIKSIKEKPCSKLRYCPYGGLVENYPVTEKDTYKSCSVFGHECPVWFEAEPFVDDV